MDYSALFTKQSEFDEFLIEKHGLEGKDLLPDKFISLDVELSELANEVRFFKFWSEKEMNRARALEEYVDALHFFLSIGNDFMVPRNHEYVVHMESIHRQYMELKKWCMVTKGAVEWHYAFAIFRGLGDMLGFSNEEIFLVYERKNQVNYTRQKEGY